VRLHADDGAGGLLHQVDQVHTLVAEDAALDPPHADGAARQVTAGDQPAATAVRLDPRDLGGLEAAHVCGGPHEIAARGRVVDAVRSGRVDVGGFSA
jgi:hypothetical protein